MQPTEVDFSYSIEFTGAEIPDLRQCRVIHWTQYDEVRLREECGYAFLYDVLKENGLGVALTTERLARYYANSFQYNPVLQYTAENFESNVVEICRKTGVDKINPSSDDIHEMGGIWGGFEDDRAGLQAELAVRGFVYERTFGTNMVVRMESMAIYASVVCQNARGLGVSYSLVPVERVYRFYNYSGMLFATVRVAIPHGFFEGYQYEKSVIAARRVVDRSLKEFLEGKQGERLLRGNVEWRKDGANEAWSVTVPEAAAEGDGRTGTMRNCIVIALLLAALTVAYSRLKSRRRKVSGAPPVKRGACALPPFT